MFYNSKGSNGISFLTFIISVKTCTICLVGLWSIVPVHPIISVHIILVSIFSWSFSYLAFPPSEEFTYQMTQKSCLVLNLNLALPTNNFLVSELHFLFRHLCLCVPCSATKDWLLVCVAILSWFPCSPQPPFIDAPHLWLFAIEFNLSVILSALGSCLIAVIAIKAVMTACSAPHFLLTLCFGWETFSWKAQEPHTLCSFKCCLKTSNLKCLC